jgi:hypothetical protein
MPVPVFAFIGFVAGLLAFYSGQVFERRQLRRRIIGPLEEDLKHANELVFDLSRQVKTATVQLNYSLNPQHFGLEESERRQAAQQAAPDPALVRRGFFSIERPPLFEITEDYARQLHKEGQKVFLHPFDPVQIDHFDNNGFQCWAVGGYRIEGVRYYTDFPAIPALYLRKILGKYDDNNLPE